MTDNNKLNDEDLKKVDGGTHLSSDEVKSLVKGQILIYEDDNGWDQAKVEYLGEWRDPGIFGMLEIKVRFLEVFHGEYIDLGYHEYIHVGDEMWISRWFFDFPERA